MTPIELIRKHQELKRTKADMDETYRAQVAPYVEGMEVLENMLQAMMLEQGVKNFPTEAGTAYQSTTMHVKLDSRADIVQFVVDKLLTLAISEGVDHEQWNLYHDDTCKEIAEKAGTCFDIFTNAISKEFVTAYIEENGAPPPGVGLTMISKVNVRKS